MRDLSDILLGSVVRRARAIHSSSEARGSASGRLTRDQVSNPPPKTHFQMRSDYLLKEKEQENKALSKPQILTGILLTSFNGKQVDTNNQKYS